MSSSSESSSASSDNEAPATRERSASRSSSNSRSRSPSSASGKSRSPAVSRRSDSTGSSSPKFVSATSSDNSLSKKSDASSTSSKGRRLVKAKDRKVSSKMAEKIGKSDDSDEENASSDEDKRKPRGRPVRAAGGKKVPAPKARKGKKETSSEEGEIASDDKEFDDGLDDDLIGDDEDRERLEKMTEREREEELFKRAENRENLKKRFEIKKKLKQQQKHKEEKKQVSDESEEGQRSDSDSDSDKSPRRGDSSSPSESGGRKKLGYGTIHDAKERSQDRRKNLDAMKKSSALSELKAKRQEREKRDQERAQKREFNKSRDDDSDDERSGGRRKKRRSRSRSSSMGSPVNRRHRRSSSSSSASLRSRSRSSSASDTERFKKSSSKQIQKYVEILSDLEPIRLSRSKLEKFVHLPFFKRLVVGCFVRIGIGANNGRSVYRLVEVCDVLETAKVYNLGNVKTNIGLRLRFGRQERVFRPEYASNTQTTEQEFEKWKNTCVESEMQLPTLEFVKNKSAEIKQAVNYEFTSEDIDKIVAQKERFHKHPVNYAMHKARLMKERDAALTNGDEARAQEFEVKLGELEERAEELDKKRTATISSVSLINDRNRKANVSKAEVAIMREIAHKKLHGQESNPFTRRRCNPRIVTKKEIEENSAPLNSIDPQELTQPNQQAATDDSLKRKVDQSTEEEANTKKSKTNNEGGMKHDLFEAHNFDIEIDVDTSFISPAASKPVFQQTVATTKSTVLGGNTVKPSKRSLNLDDYKRKRGLI